MSSRLGQNFLGWVTLIALLFTATFFLPWQRVNWGSLNIAPGKTVTVTGQSETKQKNQVATFTAGVSATSDNKDSAVSEVNQKMDAIIKSVKDFGVKVEDIQTQNMSIYQQQETYYDTDGKQKTRPGQWSVSNSIQITLRDVDRASSLADVLTKSGATNVYGPSFSLENSKNVEEKLLQEAIDDARKKASVLAAASGRKLGMVLSVAEGFQSGGFISLAQGIGGGGGAPVEPGSTTTGKSVTVVFELK